MKAVALLAPSAPLIQPALLIIFGTFDTLMSNIHCGEAETWGRLKYIQLDVGLWMIDRVENCKYMALYLVQICASVFFVTNVHFI